MIDETALQIVIKQMRAYRQNLDDNFIRNRIEEWLKTRHEPIAETSQDIIWSYQRALKEVKHVAAN